MPPFTSLPLPPSPSLQGTLYPDVIESCPPPGSGQKHSHTIKSHHNVGGLPADLKFTLIEPLRALFKDEVRALGRLPALNTLLVNCNELETLPAALARAPALARLNAANNPLRTLPLQLIDAFAGSLSPHVEAAARRVAEQRATAGADDDGDDELGDGDGGEDGGRGAAGTDSSGDAGAGAGAGAGAAALDPIVPRVIALNIDETPLAKSAALLVATSAGAGGAAKRART